MTESTFDTIEPLEIPPETSIMEFSRIGEKQTDDATVRDLPEGVTVTNAKLEISHVREDDVRSVLNTWIGLPAETPLNDHIDSAHDVATGESLLKNPPDISVVLVEITITYVRDDDVRVSFSQNADGYDPDIFEDEPETH